MDYLKQKFSVQFEYNVFFTEHLFNKDNLALREFLTQEQSAITRKLFFIVDKGVADTHPDLLKKIKSYFDGQTSFSLIEDILLVPGGEMVKNDESFFYQIVEGIDKFGIDRHSYVVAIGGGSVLDLAGYAAAVSHRGIKLIRVPTTVLSQNDSGVGVKNGINYFGKKNFLGTFAPPAAVFNDSFFLTTLSDAEWRFGTSEAVKVALIKDQAFFAWLEDNALEIAERNVAAMQYLIKRCAELHLNHIAGSDPFETGSSRPLDFGHWSAHKLEQLSDFEIPHGEAVAYGIAFDSVYSYLSGRLSKEDALRIITLLTNLGFSITHPLMNIEGNESPVLKGLNEFREHLGGKLTIMLLTGIGTGEEVHELDIETLIKTSEWLNSPSY